MVDQMASPDLSRLKQHERMNIAVALTQGGVWTRLAGAGAWVFTFPYRRNVYLYDGGKMYRKGAIADYTGDPAAWGALVEKERIVVTPFGDEWQAHAVAPAGVSWFSEKHRQSRLRRRSVETRR